MDKAKRKRLEAKGWKIGNTEDFLNDIQVYLVKYPIIRILIIAASGVLLALMLGCVPTDEVKEDSIQHMFDKCIEDDTIEECRVLVEFKRGVN